MFKALSKVEISSQYKGLPLASHGKSVASFLESKPNLFTADFQFPIMILKESALSHNIEHMAKYCKNLGILLAPHAKTPMSPQLAQRQIDAGAWGITVANFSQANIFLDYGFKRIIIGNEVIEKTSICEIARKNYLENTEIIFYIDSLAGLKIASQAIADQTESKLHFFLEIGADGGRAGIRDLRLVNKILKEIAKNPKFVIRGVTGFEGAVPDGGRRGKGITNLRKFLAKIVKAAEIVAPYIGDNKLIISGGGTSYFDYVVEEFKKYKGDADIILRSGGYVSLDHIHYEAENPFMKSKLKERFIPALELWAQVLSIPEPKLAILNFGKRDAGNDLDDPLPIKRFSKKLKPFKGVILRLNDQHAFMKIDKGSLAVADVIGCGISHPCTNFDKWRLIPVVNNDYDVVDFIHTFF